MNSRVVYPGSFDPPTNGHLEMIESAASMFKHVIVAIGRNPSKKPFCTMQERLFMLRTMTMHLPNVTVDWFEGYTVTFAEKNRANAILRGIRNTTDFEYERGIELVNRDRAENIRTVYLTPSPKNAATSSSVVKGLMGREEGWEEWVKMYVPGIVLSSLENSTSDIKLLMYHRYIHDAMPPKGWRFETTRLKNHCFDNDLSIAQCNMPILMKRAWDQLMTALFGNELANLSEELQETLSSFRNQILARYSNRVGYHSQRHILELLHLYDQFQEKLTPFKRVALLCAIWFHDYEYDVNLAAGVNEDASFDAFVDFIEVIRNVYQFNSTPNAIFNSASLVDDLVINVRYCIEATKHDPETQIACSKFTDGLSSLMADMDIATFAIDDCGQLLMKSLAVAEEYRDKYPFEIVINGRAEFLANFVKREEIYTSHWFLNAHPDANTKAKDNIAKLISDLGELLKMKDNDLKLLKRDLGFSHLTQRTWKMKKGVGRLWKNSGGMTGDCL